MTNQEIVNERKKQTLEITRQLFEGKPKSEQSEQKKTTTKESKTWRNMSNSEKIRSTKKRLDRILNIDKIKSKILKQIEKLEAEFSELDAEEKRITEILNKFES